MFMYDFQYMGQNFRPRIKNMPETQVNSKKNTSTHLSLYIKMLLIYVFVDSLFFHKWWYCHRNPIRCFFIDGRQFHICARCTGLFTGMLISPLMIFWHTSITKLFYFFLLLIFADSISQLMGIRESTNLIRFSTGFAVGLSGISALISLGGLP